MENLCLDFVERYAYEELGKTKNRNKKRQGPFFFPESLFSNQPSLRIKERDNEENEQQ